MICVSYFDAMKRHSKFVSPSGDGYVDVYELVADKNGKNEELKKTGRKNLFEEIQAYRESTEISNIINRFVNGEVDVLHQVDGYYADVTNAPTSYADYFRRVKEAEKIFEQLPDEIKDKFDNSAEKFFLEFGTDSFVNKVSDLDNPDTEVNEPMNTIKEVFDNAE